jgi:hypothetical protein
MSFAGPRLRWNSSPIVVPPDGARRPLADMTLTERAAHLRQRARHLRELATDIEALPIMRLGRYGDDDTWRGPRAALCRSTLSANQRQLHAAAEDLRWHAYQLEQQAAGLDAAARIGLAG